MKRQEKIILREKYITYLTENPKTDIEIMSEKFGKDVKSLRNDLIKCGIKLKDYVQKTYHGYDHQDIIDYAANHTMKEIMNHFNESNALLSYIHRNKIPYIKIYSAEGRVHCARERKPSGIVYDMMYLLSHIYSLASIADAFGVSREWVRQVVEGYETGKRIKPDINLVKKMEEEQNEE